MWNLTVLRFGVIFNLCPLLTNPKEKKENAPMVLEKEVKQNQAERF